MKKAWNIVRRSLKNENDYEKLFKATIESMRLARRGIVPRAIRREKYEDIAKRAEKLAKLIAEPPYVPGSNLAYTGDLDLQAYELLPEDVANTLGARSWARMTSDERSDWAYSFLPEWPTMVELLKELAGRARHCGRESMSSGGRRRGNIKARLFMRHLYKHFIDVNPKFKGWAALDAITSVVYEVELGRKTVRTVIAGSFKKRPVKRGSKSVVK